MSISTIGVLKGTLSETESLKGSVKGVGELEGKLTTGGGSSAPMYPGPYSVTPGQEAQVLSTRGKRMREDVVVGPIPQNYGLITWDGSVLTVS